MTRTTLEIAEALFRRRMAITQADALIRQAEALTLSLTAADKSADLKSYGSLLRSQSETLIKAADHILKQQVTDD